MNRGLQIMTVSLKASVVTIILILSLVSLTSVHAEELELGVSKDFVGLVPDKPYVHVIHDGRSIKIQRVQDPDYEMKGYFARSVRKCPPFCIKPMEVAPGVKTVAEPFIFAFMENELRDGLGFLIDARKTSWFEKGTIPGSINIPFTELTKEPGSDEMNAYLERFGGTKRSPSAIEIQMEAWGISDATHKTKDWDFTGAKDLILWCNGPTCGQSPRAIKGLIDAGYPKDKIFYYRGGMQMWQFFGMSTVTPK